MMNNTTPEQIMTQIESAFLPHRAKARLHDYDAKISFKVWSAKDGAHLFTVPDLPVHELRAAHYLKDVIDGTRHEVDAKLRRGSTAH